MKIPLSNESQGSVLLVTLLTSVIIGIGLASYLTLVSSQNYSTMRSLAWNTATPLAEAGIEEALTHLNDDSNLTANYWTSQLINGKTVYKKRRDFGTGGLCNPALFVKQGIDLGTDTLIDSFDSTNPAYSTDGKYDAGKVKANGNL